MTATSNPPAKVPPANIVSWIRRHARVRVILTLAVAIGLTAYVISIAVAPKSAGQIWRIIQGTWWLVLVLIFPYLAIRAFVWRQLLQDLDIEIPWRPLLASFSAGEITKSLPAGIYVENYLLAKVAHFRAHAAARSSMATTAMLGLESIVAVPVLLIAQIPGRLWIRWAMLGIIGVWVAVLAAAWLLVRYRARTIAENSPDWQQRGIRFAKAFLEAGSDLISWRTAALVLPTALYMLIYVTDLDAILVAVDVKRLKFVDVMSVYAFVVLVVILIPIPTELGLTDLSGLSALIAFGVPSATAAIVMLGLRALVTGLTIAVAGLMLFLLRSELSNAEEDVNRSGPQSPQLDRAKNEPRSQIIGGS